MLGAVFDNVLLGARLQGDLDIMQLRRAKESDLAAAWPKAISRYHLETDDGRMPAINGDLLPRPEKKWTDAYKESMRHNINGARIYGKPGSGLSVSGFGDDEIRAGSKGEELFAKLLSWDGVLDRCVSFWSVWNIDENGDRNSYGADIDCILKFGNHLFLVDVKNYRAGLDYHSLIPGHAMFCMYRNAHLVANDPYVFSCNMGIAQRNMTEFLRACGSQCTVESYVVLVPGSVGEASLDADICWPGGINAMPYSAFVSMIQQRVMSDSSYLTLERTAEEGYLASLVKAYGQIDVLKPGFAVRNNEWPRPMCDIDSGIEYPNAKKSRSLSAKKAPVTGRKGAPSRTAASGHSASKCKKLNAQRLKIQRLQEWEIDFLLIISALARPERLLTLLSYPL